MGRRLQHIEVWSDLDLAGGTRLSFIPADSVITAQDFRELNGQDWIRLSVPGTYSDSMTIDQVLRVVETAGVWREYRIREISSIRDKDGGRLLDIEAWHIIFDLQTVAPLIEFHQANGQIWLHNEWVQMRSTGLWEDAWFYKDQTPGTPAYIQKGSAPTGNTEWYDFTLDWETPGSAIIELANVLGLDLTYERNSTSYALGMSTGWNSTLSPTLITYRKNQIDVRRQRTTDGAGTRIYPRGLGDGAYTPAIGTTPVISKMYYDGSGSTLPYIVYLPSFEPDQLKDIYLEDMRRPGTIYGPITQSWSTKTRPTAGVLQRECTAIKLTTSTGATELAAGWSTIGEAIWSYLRTSTNSDSLNFVPRASSNLSSTKIRPLILDRQDIPVISNLCNEDRGYGIDLGRSESTISSATHVTVSPFASDIKVRSSSSSPFVQYGLSAAQVTFSQANARATVVANYSAGLPLSTMEPHLSVQTWFYLESGGVKLQMYASAPGSSGRVYFPSSTAPVAKATAVEQWHHIAIAPGAYNFITDYSTVVNEVGIEMYALSSGTVVYWDAWQVVNSPVPAPQIVAGSGVEKLWKAANDLYARGIDVVDFYDVGVVDLFRLDPSQYSDEEFIPGKPVVLSDPDSNISISRRVQSVRRDLMIEGNTQIELLEDDLPA